MEEKKYIEELYSALDYSSQQFDKNVLFIASGSLGISFAFIEKIVPNLETALSKSLLFCSWYCFAIVIFISLINHFISIGALRWRIKNLNEDKESQEQNWNIAINIINVMMMIGLLVGVILLISFIEKNLIN